MFLMMVMLAVVLTASGQYDAQRGVFEWKKVFMSDTVKAGKIYVRALEVLSDMCGSLHKSSFNIDIQEREDGLIVYKGRYYLGYEKSNMMYGWDTYADFTLKIRCKDGLFQVSAKVPTMTFQWDGDGKNSYSFPIKEFLPKYVYDGEYKIKKAAIKFAPEVEWTFKELVDAIGREIMKGEEEF